MTKTLSIKDVQSQLPALLALAKDGDEIIIEENGKPSARILPIIGSPKKGLVLGLSEGQVWTSDDFDDELSDKFWLGDDE